MVLKVLITGATGFLGAHLTRRLLGEGARVSALIRPSSNTWRIDDLLSSIDVLPFDLVGHDEDVAAAVASCQPDLCVHLAWYAEPGVYLHSPRNTAYIQASLNLATELHAVGCRRLVVAGSCAEYDVEYGYLSETSPTRPATLYAASKVALHTVLLPLAQQLGLEVAWARIFYTYGPGENERRFVPAVINSLLRGEPTVTTPGEQVRDHLHADDVASALWALARSEHTGTFNVGSGSPVSNRDLMLKVGAIMNRPDLIQFGGMPYREGDPMFVCADTKRLRELTGWQPQHDLDSGLRDTIDWWRKRSHA